MALTYLEIFLVVIAVASLGAVFFLLNFARRVLAETRELRGHTQDLGKSAKVQSRLLDVTPTMIAALDGMHRYLSVNQAFENAVGMSRSSLIGGKAGLMEGPAGALGMQLEAFAAQCAATDQAITEVVKFKAADGRSIDGLLIVQPYHAGEGAPQGALVALVDITARLAAEREVRDIKDTVEDLIETLPMAFFRIREEAGGHRWFPYFVGRTERFMRMSASEIRRKSGGGAMPNILEENRPAAHAALETSRANGTPIQLDLAIHRPHDDGWVRIGTAAPRRLAEGVIEWNGYLVDVTQEHREALELSLAKAAAEASAEAKSRFLAAMSHEIRTPLATAVGALELLRDTPLSAEQRQHVELMDDASHLLMEILGDILDFSRLEADQLTIEAIPFSVRELLDQVLHIFSRGAHAKGLTLDVRVAPEVALESIGDPVRLKQIILNLVGNAIKFTVTGGVEVSVTLAGENSSHVSTPQQLSIVVTDTGIGISPETLRHLFMPFAQGDASTTRQYGGSGLGLAICKRLANLMDGGISVNSEEGRGSAFDVRISLPVSHPVEPIPSLDRKRVFISVRRPQDEASLQAYACTLGLELASSSDDAHIQITDAAAPAPTQPGSGPVVALLDQSYPLPSTPPSTLALSSGPIRWAEFTKACLAALQATDSVITPPVAVPDNWPFGIPQRILVVEDHPPYQIMMQNFLKKLGLTPDVVADGPEALRRLQLSRYALIITDCHMPGMDGFELTRRVRALSDARVCQIPIVALSADFSPGHVRLSRNVGMNDFLVKPVNLATLRQCVEKWIIKEDN
ncbi:ATP-binding protein [Achromobacter aegrifaciens]|uniref:histidine kinase n=1 Tax=Achromobacter aegrifaciens TaxID=1287736 RepID=A0ABU2DJN4_ACHAE|nr:ATP-binding protein [Achromobacter aegrifaciens]MDR7948298.1 ATP-binding protein [Achromobacter aegrifaciens]